MERKKDSLTYGQGLFGDRLTPGGRGGGGQLNRAGKTTGPVKKLGPEDDAPPPRSMRDVDLPPIRQAQSTVKVPEQRPRRFHELSEAEQYKLLGLDYKPPSTFKTPKFSKGGAVKGGFVDWRK